MKFFLKHKDIDVSLLEMNEEGNITEIKEVFNKEHLPLSCVIEDGTVSGKRLAQWWNERGIPSSRENFRSVMSEIGVAGKNRLLLECRGLSLTDHYWISPQKDTKKWKNVNFY